MIVTIGKTRVLVAFITQGGVTMCGVQGGGTGIVSPGTVLQNSSVLQIEGKEHL